MDSSTESAACHSNQHHETPRRCADGCGFFGTAENRGLCSQCYKRHLKEAKAINAAQEKASTPRSRCSVCRRRLGLLGFACRCGAGFCGSHRYPEAHGCTFDFKEAGKIAIQKENPICKADKMTRKI